MNELIKARENEIQQTDNNLLDLSIIMVCWNNKDYLEPCLHFLYEDDLKSSYDIFVVDNGSTDGSKEMVRQEFPDVKIIENDSNLGLGRASNQGIEASTGRYVLLLNNDTIVNGPSLDALVRFLDANPQTAAVAGKLLNPDGSVQACYNNFPSLKEEFLIATKLGRRFRLGYPSILDAVEIKEVSWMSSACLLVRREALDEVGLLDEDYFVYGDEADLQYRLHKAGWKAHFLTQATIIHYGGVSTDRRQGRFRVYRGKMLFFKKNYSLFQTLMLRIMIGGLSVAKLIVWSVLRLFPSKQEESKKEVLSNIELIKLCWRLE